MIRLAHLNSAKKVPSLLCPIKRPRHLKRPLGETAREIDQDSADLTAAIIGYLDTFLADSQITPASIETVFLTGGTSLLHQLRQEFITRFGQEKIRDGQEFTSVADGLALSAPLFFPELHR